MTSHNKILFFVLLSDDASLFCHQDKGAPVSVVTASGQGPASAMAAPSKPVEVTPVAPINRGPEAGDPVVGRSSYGTP